MCGRYVVIQKVEVLEKRFNVKTPDGVEVPRGYNIGPGRKAPVITDENPQQLSIFSFGLTPFWAKKRMYLFNARSEGDKNKENDPAYTGAKEIFKKPSFRKPIRSQRCLVPADAFIEGSTQRKLDEPHLVHLTDREPPFAFAGIWDRWVNKETGEIHDGFSLITTVSNSLLQRIPHHRSPVILKQTDETAWLHPATPLNEVLSMLEPYPGDAMNAYPISPAIKNPRNEGRELVQPTGEYIRTDKEIVFRPDIILQGMGNKRKN